MEMDIVATIRRDHNGKVLDPLFENIPAMSYTDLSFWADRLRADIAQIEAQLEQESDGLGGEETRSVRDDGWHYRARKALRLKREKLSKIRLQIESVKSEVIGSDRVELERLRAFEAAVGEEMGEKFVAEMWDDAKTLNPHLF